MNDTSGGIISLSEIVKTANDYVNGYISKVMFDEVVDYLLDGRKDIPPNDEEITLSELLSVVNSYKSNEVNINYLINALRSYKNGLENNIEDNSEEEIETPLFPPVTNTDPSFSHIYKMAEKIKNASTDYDEFTIDNLIQYIRAHRTLLTSELSQSGMEIDYDKSADANMADIKNLILSWLGNEISDSFFHKALNNYLNPITKVNENFVENGILGSDGIPIKVGDKVQIRDGGMDVTNGKHAKAGVYYGEGGPRYATIVEIIEEWETGGDFGLPEKITKVRCASDQDGTTIVWQVQPQDLANIIHCSSPELIQTTPPENPATSSDTATTVESVEEVDDRILFLDEGDVAKEYPYAPSQNYSSKWTEGFETVSTIHPYIGNNMTMEVEEAARKFIQGDPEMTLTKVVNLAKKAPRQFFGTDKVSAWPQSRLFKTLPSKKKRLGIDENYVANPEEVWKVIEFQPKDPKLRAGRYIEQRIVVEDVTRNLSEIRVNNGIKEVKATELMKFIFNKLPNYVQNQFDYPKHIGSKQVYLDSNDEGNKIGVLNTAEDQDQGFIPVYNETYSFQTMPEYDLQKSLKGGTLTEARYPQYCNSFEENLRDFRAQVGLMVHGDNDIARLVKYFMYNRYKMPDTNLLHSKSVTYIFFTRPDLNLLKRDSSGAQLVPVDHIRNHTEAAMAYRRYPEMFKLLTDHKRCDDDNNFNMLLSNQLTNFSVADEGLDVLNAGKSWSEYTMPYGGGYTGRTGGTVDCQFLETSDFSVFNLIKLWITYIDNVSRGAWLPSYDLYSSKEALMNARDSYINDNKKTNLSNVVERAKAGGLQVNSSHVFTRTLDYAASIYLFKCAPDGEEILYWTKYYGVFPISTSSSSMSWDANTEISHSTPTLTVPFAYAWKRDMSPMALLEFNTNAGIGDGLSSDNLKDTNKIEYEESYDPKSNGSWRTQVMKPFIEFTLPELPKLRGQNLGTSDFERTKLRLKFQMPSSYFYTDDKLYRSSKVYGSSQSQYQTMNDILAASAEYSLREQRRAEDIKKVNEFFDEDYRNRP